MLSIGPMHFLHQQLKDVMKNMSSSYKYKTMVNERQILMGLNKNTINTWDPCSLVARHLVEIQ